MLAHPVLFADVVPVIAEEDHHGVLRVGALIEGIEHPADLMIHEGDASQVGPHAPAELLVIVFAQEIELGVLRQIVHPPAGFGHVQQVVGKNGRQLDLLEGEEVEPFLRGIEGDVGTDEAHP